MLNRVWNWLRRFLFGRGANHPAAPDPSIRPIPAPARSSKSVVPLLVLPRLPDDFQLDAVQERGEDRYYTSSPWEPDTEALRAAIDSAEGWLETAVGTPIKWEPLRQVSSERSVAEWRELGVEAVRAEVERLLLRWSDDYIYLAFVRGLGGYAGGIGFQPGAPGYAVVGDICIEAVCGYTEPTAGSVLLGGGPWPSTAWSASGQTGAFVHEALHGFGLPHPDGWRADRRPAPDRTIMNDWWRFPTYARSNGLTNIEMDAVREAIGPYAVGGRGR